MGNVQKISIVGGRLDPTRAQLKIKTDQSNEELKLAILGDNSVFVWSETRPNFARQDFMSSSFVAYFSIFLINKTIVLTHMTELTHLTTKL